MSTTPDIIGLVKDVQKTFESITAGSDLTEVAMGDLLHLWHNFPAIASALLERDERVAHLEREARYGNISYKEAVRLQEENEVLKQKLRLATDFCQVCGKHPPCEHVPNNSLSSLPTS